MPPAAQHRRRVGTVRPSHLIFTGGVGALIDLPNFPVLVRGLDDWRYDTVPEWAPLTERRLLAAVGRLLNAPVTQLRPPPWLDGFDADPNGQPGDHELVRSSQHQLAINSKEGYFIAIGEFVGLYVISRVCSYERPNS